MSAAPRLTWNGRFADPTAEAAYQVAQLADARAFGRLLVLSILALDVLFAAVALYNYGPNADGWLSAGLRLVVVVWSAGCWWRLGLATTPAGVERLVALWVVPVAGVNLLTLAVLPGNHYGDAAGFAVGVVLC
jgi:hypothetical protein